MEKYEVLLTPKALRDLDAIYGYVADTLLEAGTAHALIEELEKGIFSLETMPYRCPERRVGVFANRGYRQLFVRNYTILYRIAEPDRQVIILSVLYSRSDF